MKWDCRRAQAFGALVATIAVTAFVYVILAPELPRELSGDLPYDDKGHYQEGSHSPLIDHSHIERTIGQCHDFNSPWEWPDTWPRTGEIRKLLREQGAHDDENTTNRKLVMLTTMERAALFQSDRLVDDRRRYEDAAKLKHDRVRLNQIRVLLLSAAASFLIGLKTLFARNDDTVPFRSVMSGAWVPVSIAALLVPVVATVYSGILAFDDDSKTVLRSARALAQLEQLHGRIAVDLANDAYLCRMKAIDPPQRPTNEHNGNGDSVTSPAAASACVFNRAERAGAWEQRYEQIMNDASQTLAQAGDLARPGDKKYIDQPESAQEGPASRDPCALAFNVQDVNSIVPPAGATRNSPRQSGQR